MDSNTMIEIAFEDRPDYEILKERSRLRWIDSVKKDLNHNVTCICKDLEIYIRADQAV